MAGTPTATVSGGISLVTTAPIATTLFLPIVTPAFMTALLPMMALSSIVTPINFPLGGSVSYTHLTLPTICSV